MKVVLAPDSFKGTLSAKEAADIMESEILKFDKNIEVVKLPVADGGEGTEDILKTVLGGELCRFKTVNAIGEIKAKSFLKVNDDVIIESAKIIGLPEVFGKSNPLVSSSFGLGIAIKAALKYNPKTIYISLGGSATNDGGSGMLEALGARFFDNENRLIKMSGSALKSAEKIDLTLLDKRLQGIKLVALSDVTNPLLGENGASHIFAPQKGASILDVEFLEKGMQNYHDKIKLITGKDCSKEKGAGAAGGIGYILKAAFNAEIKSGINEILNLINFQEKAADADYVFSGEGKVDSQSFCGKVISGIGKLIKPPTKFIVIGGLVKNCLEQNLKTANVFKIYSMIENEEPIEKLKLKAAYNLATTTAMVIKELLQEYIN